MNAVLFAVAILCIEDAHAAQCRGALPIPERFELHNNVFLAKITAAQVETGHDGEVLRLTFDVVESYKGSAKGVRLIADSGAHVERSDYSAISVGAYYVVFAGASGSKHLGLCSQHLMVLYEGMRVSGVIEELRKLAVDNA
jgi:hypothetical protein